MVTVTSIIIIRIYKEFGYSTGGSTFSRVISSLEVGDPIQAGKEEPRRARSLSPACPRRQHALGPLPSAQTVPGFNGVQVQGAALGSRPIRGRVRDSSPRGCWGKEPKPEFQRGHSPTVPSEQGVPSALRGPPPLEFHRLGGGTLRLHLHLLSTGVLARMA